MEDDHLGHLDELLDHLDEHRPEPKDALAHQFRPVRDQAQFQTNDPCVHLHRHLVGQLLGQLDV
jgi:hypothetical protein